MYLLTVCWKNKMSIIVNIKKGLSSAVFLKLYTMGEVEHYQVWVSRF